jgi:transcriptional regulator with AAA-type ATPase domain
MTDAPTTLPGPSWVRGAPRREGARSLALVIAWSGDEPARVGEVALVPDDGVARVLGRGAGAPGSPRLGWRRQRPGIDEAVAPLGGRGVSREHLRVRAAGDALEVERIGRGELLVNGVVATRAAARPGDTLVLRHALVLYLTERPDTLPARRYLATAGVPGFGAPDAHGLVGESEAAWRLRDQIAFAAGATAHVLILGASGCGKELVAGAIHAQSARGGRPLVARNAATLPEGLIDAELFGNIKDYPNPGMRERPGLVGEAQGSTLFLDEIGELPEALQAHLLRLLDGGEYHRLGEARSRRADVRLLAATNRDPAALKHDLAARLTVRVAVPGLEERREDIPLIARHLVRKMAAGTPALARLLDGDEPRIHPDVIQHLLRRRYRHHVRDLEAFLWRAVQASAGDRDHVAAPPDSDGASDGETGGDTDGDAAAETQPAATPAPDAIRSALTRHAGNVSLAWRELGLSSRYALQRLMRKHGIRRGE